MGWFSDEQSPAAAPPTEKCGKSRRRSRGKSRRRSRGRSKGRRKCCPGKRTRNPFLAFLRYYRMKHCGWPATKIVKRGARAWCSMSRKKRARFYMEACSAPRRPRSSCKSKSRKGGCGRSRSTKRRSKRGGRRSRSSRRHKQRSKRGCGSRRKSHKRKKSSHKRRCRSSTTI